MGVSDALAAWPSVVHPPLCVLLHGCSLWNSGESSSWPDSLLGPVSFSCLLVFVYLQLKSNAELNRISGFIHFACTSEDINNLAYALMVKQAM